MRIHTAFIMIIALLMAVSCAGKKTPTVRNHADSTNYNRVDTLVKQAGFQKEIGGKRIDLYTLKNKGGVTVKITNYGACIVQVLMPDKNGRYENINLGYPVLDGYMNDNMYLGATVGRYANRIAKGKFRLDGKTYSLAVNNGVNSLHGGIKGFNKVVWDATKDGNTLKLKYVSPDMEEGYPGELTVNLTYTLTPANELRIEFNASTNKKTIVNLTNHAYYNLKGEGSGEILDHVLEIFADHIIPVDLTLIPSGKLMQVDKTPFDFRKAKQIGQDINDTLNQQIRFGKGYDHCWVLNKIKDSLSLAARLSEPQSGRVLEFWTTEPGIQFYSGNFMNGTVKGISGKSYAYRNAVALEPQHFPDSPNHPEFPSVLLKPGETYHHLSVVKFSNQPKDVK